MEVNEDREWSGLYKIGAIAAILILLIYLIELVVIVSYGLPPETVEGWFAALHHNRLVGLVQTFGLDLVPVAMHAPLYLALYYLLRQSRKLPTTLLMAVLMAWIGLAVYFATNITFSMLYLSDQFALATSEAQKTQLLTSGQTLLAIYNGTGPFVAYLLYAISGILVSVVMLRSRMFARWVAIVGIIGNALELGLPPSLNPPFFMQIDPFLVGAGGVILLFWYGAIALKFIQVSRS